MDPLTGSLILGTLLDTTFQVFGASMKNKAAEIQSQQAIQVAQENQRRALFAGRVQQEQIIKKGKIIEGADIARTAGSGVALSGSSLDVIMQNVTANSRDADMAMYNATMKGNDYMREGYTLAARYQNSIAENNLNAVTGVASSVFKGYTANLQNQRANDLQNIQLANQAELLRNQQENNRILFYIEHGDPRWGDLVDKNYIPDPFNINTPNIAGGYVDLGSSYSSFDSLFGDSSAPSFNGFSNS